MSKSTWTGKVSSDWNDPNNWSPAGVPGVNSDVVITTGAPVASASIGTVNSITDSSDLSFESAGTNTVTTFLDNTGSLLVDSLSGAGGTSLTVGGALDSSFLYIGNHGLSSSDSVTADFFHNTGLARLIGNGSNFATLNVSGDTINDGKISIDSDTEELAGAVGGKGIFRLSNANLQFDSSVSAQQIIHDIGADALTLEQAQFFAGKINGFGTGDTIDAANFLLSGTTFNFVENSAGTGGTLTLHDGSLTAHIRMGGVYSNSDFTLAPDSGTGTLVKFA